MEPRSSRTASRSAGPPSSGASLASPHWTRPPPCSSQPSSRPTSWRCEPSTNGARGGQILFVLDAPVTGKRQVARGMFVIGMRAPEIASAVRAGQFVNLRWPGGPLLRRPFSVYRAEGEHIEVVLKAVGSGTRQMLAMEVGDRLSCLGPLGRGFDFGAGAREAVLVSGGLGVAPMLVAARDARAAGMEVTWGPGARTAAELCSEMDGDTVIWATDDGSQGIARTAVAGAPGAGVVIACGANPLLPAAAERWPEAQVAVETYMGCGTGVCLGCAVPLQRGGYDRACKEGPVYRAADIDWSMLPAHLPYAISA